MVFMMRGMHGDAGHDHDAQPSTDHQRHDHRPVP